MADFPALKAFEAEVFKGFPKVGTGRPVDKQRDPILKTWRDLGEPDPARNTLAQKIYGPKFGADATTRRKHRDRCRQAVERALKAERKRNRIDIDIFP